MAARAREVIVRHNCPVAVAAAAAVLVAAACALGACGGRNATTPSANARQCLRRGPAVTRRAPAAGVEARSSHVLADAVAVSERAVVYRGDDGRVVARAISDGAVLGSADAAGSILFGNERGVTLWATGPGERRLVRVTFADGKVLRSSPLPLPPWVLASSELEPAESVSGTPEGEDVVLAWSAYTSWTGGYPPSPEEKAGAHNEDCGSLRVDARGRVTEGGELEAPVAPVPRSPIPARSYLQQVYAGEGVYWTNDIDPKTDRVTHALVEASGASVEVRLPPLPPETRGDIAAVVVGERVVLLRTLHRLARYEHARSVFVVDRRTAAHAWTAAVAPLIEVPPRP